MCLFAITSPTITFSQLVFWLLWSGLVALTAALIVLLYTRWGQSKPLGKCLVLSLFAHVLLALYATTVQLRFEVPFAPEPVTHVLLGDDRELTQDQAAHDQPWEKFDPREMIEPTREELAREQDVSLPETQRSVDDSPMPVPGETPIDHVAQRPAEPEQRTLEAARPETFASTRAASPTVEEPQPQRREAPSLPLPEAAPAGPPPASEHWLADLERRSSPGVPEALLAHLTPLPRLNESSLPTLPADALPDPSYQAAAASRGAAPPDVRPHAVGAGVVPPLAPAAPPGSPAQITRQHSAGPINAQVDGSPMPAAAEPGSLPTAQPNVASLTRRSAASNAVMPERYLWRTAPDKLRWAERQGASAETEAAVQAALRWLAAAQARDGRWDSSDFGGGREDQVLGRNRQSAGIEADAGVSGLALLAFLAAGHTHLTGDYQETVRRGLQYLLSIQANDGNLAGSADNFSRMYCHAMATLAVTEALGMTGDDRLREPARRALAYTVACQSPSTGGWRYVPADPGDTSQLGWQWMALKSGELAGIPIPERTRQGVVKFLQSVASGSHGGLAAYRPGERPTRPMTAEALYCWMLLGVSADHPAVHEATEAIMGEMPGVGRHNCYYWYYATLALYQLQNDHWLRWNDAVTRTLLARQERSGPQAGSWNTDTVWGGYGGRVYTTAISALTLEVYYRYLPLYGRPTEAAVRPQPQHQPAGPVFPPR